MDVELGMPESEILFYVNPREFNAGFELLEKHSGKYKFINKTNEDFDIEITFKVENQRITVIDKLYKADNLQGMETLSGYYDESVKSWSMKDRKKKNESMRRKVYESF